MYKVYLTHLCMQTTPSTLSVTVKAAEKRLGYARIHQVIQICQSFGTDI